MAGKRMKLNMSMNVFSMNPVDRKVLHNWSGALNTQALETAIRVKLIDMDIYGVISEGVHINYTDSRQISSIVDILGFLNPHGEAVIRATPVNGIEWVVDDTTQCDLTVATVLSVAGVHVDSGMEIMLMLNAYRAIVLGLPGPMPGFNLNITIAGVVATCLRLGVPIEFESD